MKVINWQYVVLAYFLTAARNMMFRSNNVLHIFTSKKYFYIWLKNLKLIFKPNVNLYREVVTVSYFCKEAPS